MATAGFNPLFVRLEDGATTEALTAASQFDGRGVGAARPSETGPTTMHISASSTDLNDATFTTDAILGWAARVCASNAGTRCRVVPRSGRPGADAAARYGAGPAGPDSIGYRRQA